MPTKDAKKRITEVVSSWEGITLTHHWFGAFMLGKRELGVGEYKDSAIARPTARGTADAPENTNLNRR
jgi:hypothetical protein